ncbi:sigma-70 family RNA polymerase sigma factor (plasmid) [Burkholderia glumae]|uniref:Sigma-70 family RNA polymerase sigma factor n=2 Tax=Burkholderia glumae TaxID=337 RepID=A0AAQ0BUV6_BURGL|nr:sigma-70 family RNA polymerase sigma factor [Burkholderia glumae]ACR32767.1 Putative RNA polymerase sigma factor [Burkholderia glumae BGR1]AJY62346.1 RNA polymerase sigma factor, sigma-70 family protein [Burkholderia glumae LMG 2196 = ATCC 33617]NVE26240.1 sigma-70 family RNA polymerase sigma factor [Burkholderia glumae]PNK93243.1 RNA polymerase subunit sigma [Burkholderia glumae]QGA41856.1 sigma-70 family RNA polymerase sigma factor [Burkholderia glumae]
MYPVPSGRDEVAMNDVNANISRAELAQLRNHLLRFARLQLRDDAAAEDAVQDAMLAAMSKMADFRGHAQLSTWVFAILRNKIIDIMRTRKRYVAVQEIDELPADSFDVLFDERDRWQIDERPAFWGDPEATLEQQQFWTVFQTCLDRLPPSTARVFMMREFLELEPEEVAAELAISKSNCGVILHRARMALRVCLQTRWFNERGDRKC